MCCGVVLKMNFTGLAMFFALGLAIQCIAVDPEVEELLKLERLLKASQQSRQARHKSSKVDLQRHIGDVAQAPPAIQKCTHDYDETTKIGVITTPNFPNLYPKSFECSVLVKAHWIGVEMEASIEEPNAKECIFDYVIINVGQNYVDDNFEWADNGKKKCGSFNISFQANDYINVSFKSDAIKEMPGFKIKYTMHSGVALDGTCENSYDCLQYHTLCVAATCQCKPYFKAESGLCKVAVLDNPCSSRSDCPVTNSECSNNLCKCTDGYKQVYAECISLDLCMFGDDCSLPCHCEEENDPAGPSCDYSTGKCLIGNICKFVAENHTANYNELEETWKGDGCQTGNVALNKQTYSSVSTSNHYYAVNGKIADNLMQEQNVCASILSDSGTVWWMVDLGHLHKIERVKIYYSRDMENLQKLHEAMVTQGNTTDVSVQHSCGTILVSRDILMKEVACDVAARYISIQQSHATYVHELVLCEVQVIGYKYIDVDYGNCESRSTPDKVYCTKCRPGFKLPSCRPSGIIIDPVDCGDPPIAPSNGERLSGYRTTEGSIVMYKCNDGYKFTPDTSSKNLTAVCHGSGNWNLSTQAKCIFDCGGKIEVGSYYKHLTSPNFPDVYLDKTNCTWFLHLYNPGDRIKMSILSIDMEYSPDCSKDHLALYDSDGVNAYLLGKYCGTVSPDEFYTYGHILVVEFVSDQSTVNHGFRIEYVRAPADTSVLVPENMLDILHRFYPEVNMQTMEHMNAKNMSRAIVYTVDYQMTVEGHKLDCIHIIQAMGLVHMLNRRYIIPQTRELLVRIFDHTMFISELDNVTGELVKSVIKARSVHHTIIDQALQPLKKLDDNLTTMLGGSSVAPEWTPFEDFSTTLFSDLNKQRGAQLVAVLLSKNMTDATKKVMKNLKCQNNASEFGNYTMKQIQDTFTRLDGVIASLAVSLKQELNGENSAAVDRFVKVFSDKLELKRMQIEWMSMRLKEFYLMLSDYQGFQLVPIQILGWKRPIEPHPYRTVLGHMFEYYILQTRNMFKEEEMAAAITDHTGLSSGTASTIKLSQLDSTQIHKLSEGAIFELVKLVEPGCKVADLMAFWAGFGEAKLMDIIYADFSDVSSKIIDMASGNSIVTIRVQDLVEKMKKTVFSFHTGNLYQFYLDLKKYYESNLYFQSLGVDIWITTHQMKDHTLSDYVEKLLEESHRTVLMKSPCNVEEPLKSLDLVFNFTRESKVRIPVAVDEIVKYIDSSFDSYDTAAVRMLLSSEISKLFESFSYNMAMEARKSAANDVEVLLKIIVNDTAQTLRSAISGAPVSTYSTTSTLPTSTPMPTTTTATITTTPDVHGLVNAELVKLLTSQHAAIQKLTNATANESQHIIQKIGGDVCAGNPELCDYNVVFKLPPIPPPTRPETTGVTKQQLLQIVTVQRDVIIDMLELYMSNLGTLVKTMGETADICDTDPHICALQLKYSVSTS